jgi:two-component system, LytTR family, response regulator LytT
LVSSACSGINRWFFTRPWSEIDVLTIGICDDEPEELDCLGRLIEDFCRQRNLPFGLHPFQMGMDLLTAMSKGQCFDMLFLDVYLKDTDGISVAREVREFDRNCCIVFVTNSRSHAVMGFEVQALHYLLKPATPKKIASAFNRALGALQDKVDKNIQVQNRKGSYKISFDDIIYAESNARIITLHLRSREGLKYYDRLDRLEQQCADDRFLRCHQSFLVNLDHVRSIVNNKIRMKTGEEIPITMSVIKAKELFAFHMAKGI